MSYLKQKKTIKMIIFYFKLQIRIVYIYDKYECYFVMVKVGAIIKFKFQFSTFFTTIIYKLFNQKVF